MTSIIEHTDVYQKLREDRFRRTGISLDSEAKARLIAVAERQIREQLEPLERKLRPLLKTPARQRALAEHIVAVGDAYGIRVLLNANLGSAFARVNRREVHLRFIDSDAAAASGYHELGHHLAPPCEGGDHYHILDGHTHICVMCEVQAWERGMDLALDWSGLMHEELQRCIGSYAKGQTGTPQAFDAVRRVASRLTLLEQTTKHRLINLR